MADRITPRGSEPLMPRSSRNTPARRQLPNDVELGLTTATPLRQRARNRRLYFLAMRVADQTSVLMEGESLDQKENRGLHMAKMWINANLSEEDVREMEDAPISEFKVRASQNSTDMWEDKRTNSVTPSNKVMYFYRP